MSLTLRLGTGRRCVGVGECGIIETMKVMKAINGIEAMKAIEAIAHYRYNLFHRFYLFPRFNPAYLFLQNAGIRQ